MKLISKDSIFVAVCSYDERMIPKEASFRWDPNQKRWWTDNPEKAAKLIQYADDICKEKITEIARKREETLAASKAVSSNIDIPCPEGLAYLPFQKAGIEYCLNKDNVLIADQMGCIDGESIIQVLRAGKSGKFKLKDAYKRFHQKDRKNHNWDQAIPTYIRSLGENRFIQHKVKTFLHKGTKEVLEIQLEDGKKLKCTPDHLILTESGWKKAENLSISENVLVNGTSLCKNCKSPKNIITYKHSKFLGYCKKCMYKTLRSNPRQVEGIARRKGKDGYIYLTGTTVQNYPRRSKSGVLEHLYLMEQKIGRALEKDEEVHHINGIRDDNRLENLQLVTKSEHKKIHQAHLRFKNYIHGRGKTEIITIPKVTRVKAIEKVGLCEVYDIAMEEPFHNFLANNIVVHNCGKTIQAIGVINVVRPKTVLIVTPASLKINWHREITKWVVHNYSIDIANGSYFPDTDIVICNYDILYKFTEEREKWDLLIADEIHFCKSKTTRRSQALFSIKAHKIIGLSGTPILNKPVELQPILEFLQPQNPQWKFWPYTQNFCNAHKVQITRSRTVWDFSGASKLSQLQEILRIELMIRRTKEEVLKELPPKRRQIIELPQNGAEKVLEEENKAWEKSQDKIASLKTKAELAKAESEESYLDAVEKLREANLASFEELSKLRHKTAVAKVPAVIEHIKDSLENEEKIVLFAHHHNVIDKIYEAFPGISVRLTGRDNQQDRQKAVDNFQTDPNCKLFIGSITAAGVGLTLTASSHVIFAELDWVPSNLTQCEDRSHRIGTVNSVLIQHLVFNDSLDARMAKTIVAKQEVIDKALDAEIEKEPIIIEEEEIATKKISIKKIAEEAEKLTETQIKAIHEGLQKLAFLDSDRATEKNEQGFSKFDSQIGNSLAKIPFLSPKQSVLGRAILLKYARQLGQELIERIR